MVSDDLMKKTRKHFLGWQCRLRQYSIRNLNAEPSQGMCPDIVVGDTGAGYEGVTVLLIRKDPAIFTAEFRHMVQRTRDPKLRFDSALKYLAEYYYQHSKEFSDRMTAIFPLGSSAARRMLEEGQVTLLFDEKNQRYQLPCTVQKLDENDPAWQATYWHNHLFNPVMPGDIPILQFTPDWASVQAEPPVN